MKIAAVFRIYRPVRNGVCGGPFLHLRPGRKVRNGHSAQRRRGTFPLLRPGPKIDGCPFFPKGGGGHYNIRCPPLKLGVRFALKTAGDICTAVGRPRSWGVIS